MNRTLGLRPTSRFAAAKSSRLVVPRLSMLVLPWVTILLALSPVAPLPAAANLADARTAVEAGRSALQSGWDYPWYDSDADGLARIDVQPPRRSTNNTTRRTLNWDFGEVLAVMGWVLIAVLLAVIVYALMRAFVERERTASAAVADDGRVDSSVTMDRVEVLPIAADRRYADLLAEARRFYQQGDLSESIVYLFSYQLWELDRHHMLRLAKGKTNRQYLREIRAGEPAALRSQLSELLRNTMEVFESAFFGGCAPTRVTFESCWNQCEQFRALLDDRPSK